ncbi:hypothetical protein Cme02nite_50320 [Catellatospora methionotrophica]|uniref:Uncharacterized protein n=1 Tax=Catellatospora methionotrophica TaxID=121620 RepID=A0A8J3LDV1_9ACTN|nr:hypothetical protein [Catellatospora methionotrophica]GIG16700.1 hypothetical protein Cme02nite_50320 [Catellatospora methionotrophica]
MDLLYPGGLRLPLPPEQVPAPRAAEAAAPDALGTGYRMLGRWTRQRSPT